MLTSLICCLVGIESRLALLKPLSSLSFSLTKLWKAIIADTISIWIWNEKDDMFLIILSLFFHIPKVHSITHQRNEWAWSNFLCLLLGSLSFENLEDGKVSSWLTNYKLGGGFEKLLLGLWMVSRKNGGVVCWTFPSRQNKCE